MPNFNLLNQGVPPVQPPDAMGGLGNIVGLMNAQTARQNLMRENATRTALSNILTGAADPSAPAGFNFELAATRLTAAGYVDEAKKITEIRAKIPSARSPDEQLAILKDAMTVAPVMARLAERDPNAAAAFLPGFQSIFGPGFTGTPDQLANLAAADLKPLAERIQLVDKGGQIEVVDPAAMTPGDKIEKSPTPTAELNARVRRETATDDALGGSVRAKALTTLVNLRAKERSGEPLTDEEEDLKTAALFELEQPQLRMGPNGEIVTVEPVVPAGLRDSALQPPGAGDAALEETRGTGGATTPPTPPPAPEGGQTGRPSVASAAPPAAPTAPPAPAAPQQSVRVTAVSNPRTTQKMRDLDVARKGVTRTVGKILDIVEESTNTGENILGIEGAIRASDLGQMSRQFGTSVSPAARRLASQLEILRSQLTKPILGEVQLAEAERKRLDTIIEKLSSGTLDRAALNAMVMDVIEFSSLLTQSVNSGSLNFIDTGESE